jgi:hypothetical protein
MATCGGKERTMCIITISLQLVEMDTKSRKNHAFL